MMKIEASNQWSIKKIAITITIATFVLSSLIGFGVAELIIRRLYPQNTYTIAKTGVVSVFKKSDLIPFELKSRGFTHHIAPTHEFANDITTNNLGYRGPEFSETKPNGTFRILMLGDSTTFGIGSNDDQTFPFKLQELLEARDEGNIEVLNAGFTSGLSPDTYYLYLKEKGLALDPDIVFVNLFLSNDISDLFENDWAETDESGLPLKVVSKERQIDREGRLVFRQTDWKYRFPLIRDLHVGILALNLVEQKLPTVERLLRWLVNAPDLLDDIPIEEQEKCLYLNQCSDRFNGQWQRLEIIFTGFKKLSDSTGTPIIMTLMAPQYQLTAHREREEIDYNLSVEIPQPQETNNNFPQKRLIKILDDKGLPYFDLLKGMRGKGGNPLISDTYVYKEDRHFTPEGNLAIAEAYAEYLEVQDQGFQ
ncbi:MAG: SGNH/GDSL hydrolase family protein [Candidatus Chisholmbacteria bacterium]|nr:SGNH/GDSL hydrolase family protein [Candidatus Chisholmbacteria bacterium]